MSKEKQTIRVEQDDARTETNIRVRRGRTALALTLAGGLFAGGVATGVDVSNAIHDANTPPPLSGETFTIGQGDTLWNEAVKIAPDRDPRDVVDEIMKGNHIVDAGSIEPGQTFYIPLDLVDTSSAKDK